MKNQSYTGIFIVILCAMVGYTCTYFAINCNLVQYCKLPSILQLERDSTTPADTDSNRLVNYPVKSHYPIDNLRKKNNNTRDTVATLSIATINSEQPVDTSKPPVIKTFLFHDNPHFLIWTILKCLVITLAAGSFPVFYKQIFLMCSRFRLNRNQIIQSFACLLIFYFLILRSNSYSPGYYKPEKISSDFGILLNPSWIFTALIIANLALTIPIVTVMFMVAPASDNIMSRLNTKTEIEKAAYELEYLNQQLLGALRLLAVIVVFAVLSSTALMLSIKATFTTEPFDIFPTDASVVYGIFFSLFLGIVYIPVYYYLVSQNNRLKESIAQLTEGRKECEELVKSIVNVDNSALDNMKLSFTVLTPFISSILPSVFDVF